MTLYKEDGSEAGIKEVVEWFNWIYPSHIFVTHPMAIVRGLLNAIHKGVLTTKAIQEEEEE